MYDMVERKITRLLRIKKYWLHRQRRSHAFVVVARFLHNGPRDANKRIHNETFYSVNDNCVSAVDPRNKVMENSRNRLEGLN